MFSSSSTSARRWAWARYGVAFASVVLGWLAREGLTPAVGQTALPFIFFFPAVAMAAWYGGLGPGALATIFSAAAANWFFIEPVHTFAMRTSYDVVALAAFLVSCGFIVGAMEAMHRARAKARAELTERERLEAELGRVRKMFATTIGGVGNVSSATDASTRSPFPKAEARGAKPGLNFINVLFLAAAVLLVSSTIIVYQVGLIRIDAQEKMAGQLLVLQQLEDFISALKDTETGQRGFLLTHDESYLEPYAAESGQVRTRLEGLRHLASSGELPKDRVERLAALSEQKLTELAQTIQLRRDQGLDAALAVVRDNQGKQVIDEIRAVVLQMRGDEEKEFTAASRRADGAADIRTGTFVGATLLNLLFLGWAFRRISREVSHREAADLDNGRQKELLATTLASIGDAVIATDSDGRVIFLNLEAEKLTGWRNSDAAGRPLAEIFRIINEQTRQPAENPVEKVLRLGAVVGLANHTLLVRRDGTEFPIDDSAAPIRHPDGPLFGVVLVFRDFTEQRMREQQLTEQAGLLELSTDTIFVRDMHDRITYWNHAAEEIYGYTREEAVGKVTRELLKTGFPEPLERINETLQRENRWSGELVHTTRDGRRITVSSRWALDRDAAGNLASILETNNDITERKHAEVALRESQERIVRLINSAMDAIIAVDAQQRITLFNPAAEQMFGCLAANAIGGSLDRFIPPRFRDAHRGHIEKFGQTGVTSRRMGSLTSLTGLRASGEEFPIEASISQVEVGGQRSFKVILRDITERKRADEALVSAQEQLKHHAANLETTVAERTVKLQEMVDELQHVSYAIAHDMRAPLRAMSAFASLMSEQAASGITPAQTQDYSRRIIVAASRLDRLIQDALHYTKVAQQEMKLEPVNLSKLIPDLIETYPNLQPHSAEIRIEGQLPVVIGNEALLTQCFSNLLGNAVKFVAPGTKPDVRVSAETRNGMARIWVEDNGIGIPKHAQTRLFGMFQKLNAKYEGTGIGLAIVRKVAQRMGGKAGAESEAEMGSKFWVELPVAADDVQATELPQTP